MHIEIHEVLGWFYFMTPLLDCGVFVLQTSVGKILGLFDVVARSCGLKRL